MPDLTPETYEVLTWFLSAIGLLFAIFAAFYYLADIVVFFRQTVFTMFDQLHNWFDWG